MGYLRGWALRSSQYSNDDGATAVEYGIMVAAIAAVIVAIVFAIGAATDEAFTDTCTAMDTHMTCSP